MKTNSRLRYFIYFSILIVGCTTGKNALQKGNYDVSVFKAIDRLKSSPRNAEAMQVLPKAYNLAYQSHLRGIDEAKISSDMLRWETVLSHYQKLNQLSDEISSSPIALGLVPNAPRFNAEVDDSKYRAAEVRYTLGVNQLSENSRTSAKNAYYNFEKAQYFYPNFNGVSNKLNEAYWAAVLKVVVQPVFINNTYYKLSNQYFQQQVDQFMGNYKRNKFVAFYSPQEASRQKITANQVISLGFDDFIVGQTYVKEKVEKLKRDSVLIEESRANGKVYGTVNATLSVFNKTVTSSGLLSFVITDNNSNKVIRHQRIPGTFIWQDSWASYNGDDRALSNQQLNMAKRREILPPAPASLFLEFTKPIYAQLVDEVNDFYSRY